MSNQIYINAEIYKKFLAALTITRESEEVVLCRLIEEYAHAVFEKAMGKEKTNTIPISADMQKQLFVSWFRNLTRNGKPYNPVTISGYTGRIENACCDPIFASVPVKNLFTINDLTEFLRLQDQIKSCAGFSEFDAKSHNGFTAALRKYSEFLRFQSSGTSTQVNLPSSRQAPASNIHRWTFIEDLICCKRFLEYYVIQKSSMDIAQFLRILSKEVPDISEGSLRMKIQNIKFLSMQAGMHDSAAIKWLNQYSSQCEQAFQQALYELKLIK